MALVINGAAYSAVNVTASGDVTAGDDIIATDDVEVGDDIVLTAGGTITSTANGDVVIMPHGTGITEVGDAGSTSHALSTNDDLFVSGDLEVDGKIYADGDVTMPTAGTVFQIRDNAILQFGSGQDCNIFWGVAQTNDAQMLSLGTDSRSLIICETGDQGFNFAHAQQTDPTLYIHSANQATDEWMSEAHNQTDAVKGIGKGGHVTNHGSPVDLADDGTFSLPDASAGFGFMIVGDSEEYVHFVWDSAANVDLITNSANVVAADTDANFCIFDGGTAVTVKNRLGAAKKIVFDYHYTTP